MSELVVPGRITNVTTIDPGEVRIIELTVPKEWEVDGVTYPIHDTMRPGTAFLAKPWGVRTGKWRRRMYTRSNATIDSANRLETIINFTHTEKSDSSEWWQTGEILEWEETGQTIEIRVQWNEDHSALLIYENSRSCHPSNLRLESDGEWEHLRIFALALSTGVTPFLSYLRYMQHFQFGRTSTHQGASVTLVVSVQHEQQLMAHEELLALQGVYPHNFTYHPVLTKSWPGDWPFTTGRIIQIRENSEGESMVDLGALLNVCPHVHQHHVRFCGNKVARDQLLQGLKRYSLEPPSFRAEVW